MAHTLPLLATRVLDRPLLLEERKLAAILGVLEPRLFDADVPLAETEEGEDDADDAAPPPKPYRVTPGGVAVLPVVGTLVQRGAWVGAHSGLVSYQGLRYSLLAAQADPQVRGILLDIDSGGGEVEGCFDLTDLVHRLRDRKPIWAVADGQAFSAAYALAAACAQVWVTRTGGVGSVGVWTAHLDQSKALEQKGLRVTMVRAGQYKAEHNSYEPLSAHAKSSLQAEVDDLYTLFVDTVARYRSLDGKKVAGTEAQLYWGQKGLDIGFADRIGTLEEALAELEAQVRPTETASLEESAAALPAEYAGQPDVVRLTEARGDVLPPDAFTGVDADSLQISEVTVLKVGRSLNGRYWSPEAVADVARLLPQKVTGYWGHGEDSRDARDWAVVWERGWLYQDACKGALKIFAHPDGEALKERIDYVRTHQAGHLFGVSVDALVRQEMGTVQGERLPIVRQVLRVYCVDVVMVPGAGGSFVDTPSPSPSTPVAQEPSPMTLAELRVAYPDLVEALTTEVQTQAEDTSLVLLEEQTAQHQAHLADLQAQLATLEQARQALQTRLDDLSGVLEAYLFEDWLQTQVAALPESDRASEAGQAFVAQQRAQGPAQREAIALAVQTRLQTLADMDAHPQGMGPAPSGRPRASEPVGFEARRKLWTTSTKPKE